MNEDSDKKIKEISLSKFLIRRGSLIAFILSVVFNFYSQIKEHFTLTDEEFRSSIIRYFVIIVIVALIFFVVLVEEFFHNKKIKLKQKNKFRVLEEEDELDIQELSEKKAKITCKQNLKIQALESQEEYFTFYPLSGKAPKIFKNIGSGDEPLDISSLKEDYDGVKIKLSHDFAKKETDELIISWEYNDYPIINRITTTFIRRPTECLKIIVKLPVNYPKPAKIGCTISNLEKFSIEEKIKIDCSNYNDQEKRWYLNKNFKTVKEGYRYAIWWEPVSISNKH